MGTVMGLNQKLPASPDWMSHAQLIFIYNQISFLTLIFKTRTRKIRCTKWLFLSLWSTDVVVKIKIKQNPSTLKTKNKRPALNWPSGQYKVWFQYKVYFKDPLIFEIHIKLKYIYFNFYTIIKYLTARSATYIYLTVTRRIYFYPKTGFYFRTCEDGAGWHLIPCRISPRSEFFFSGI